MSASGVRLARPTDEHLRLIAETMREEDRIELRASTLLTPHQALIEGVRRSHFVAVVLADDVPLAVLGLVQKDVLSGTGIPWLLSSQQALKHKRQFFELSPPIIQEMLSICPKLVNYVHSENRLSIKWLKWLGFEIEEPIPFGVHGEMFHRFHLEV